MDHFERSISVRVWAWPWWCHDNSFHPKCPDKGPDPVSLCCCCLSAGGAVAVVGAVAVASVSVWKCQAAHKRCYTINLRYLKAIVKEFWPITREDCSNKPMRALTFSSLLTTLFRCVNCQSSWKLRSDREQRNRRLQIEYFIRDMTK